MRINIFLIVSMLTCLLTLGGAVYLIADSNNSAQVRMDDIRNKAVVK